MRRVPRQLLPGIALLGMSGQKRLLNDVRGIHLSAHPRVQVQTSQQLQIWTEFFHGTGLSQRARHLRQMPP